MCVITPKTAPQIASRTAEPPDAAPLTAPQIAAPHNSGSPFFASCECHPKGLHLTTLVECWYDLHI